MITLVSIPEIIKDGETLKVQLDIQGKINKSMYKGSYFNLTIKKNGGDVYGTTTLYPLRYNGFPLEWEINPNSYNTYGTFNVTCKIQDGVNITNTTFIVEEDCIIKKVNTCNNITNFIQATNYKSQFTKKIEEEIDYTRGCSIQKPGTILKEQEIINKQNLYNNNQIISNVKVQKNIKNVGPS